MNWWLIGLCVSVMLLWIRQWGSIYRWNQMVKTLTIFTEMIGALGDMPQGKIDEGRKVWTEARINAEKQLAVTSVFIVAIVIFLIALMVRGRI